MAIAKKLKDTLLSLTWEGLCNWSDSRSVERGKGYLSRVAALSAFPDGDFVAEVHGTDTYYTRLSVDEKGQLRGTCSCPVGFRCKHCVAVALLAAKRLKADDEIPDADLTARRWKRAAEELQECDDLEDFEDESVEDEISEDDAPEGLDKVADPTSRRSAAKGAKTGDLVTEHLDSLDAAGLRALVDELLSSCADSRPYLRHKLEMARATTSDLVRRARREIKTATSGYYDHWDRRYGHDEIPDYSPVKECFARLRDAGDFRSLMELGADLKRRATSQEEQSNDEDGEIGAQVAACMDIVAEAVMASDMDVLDKVKWEEDIQKDDDFCLLDGMDVSYRTALKADAKAWGRIADYLAKLRSGADESGRMFRSHRERLCEALERAGRAGEAVDLLKAATADDAMAVVDLADLLCRLGRRKDAETCCQSALAKSGLEPGSYQADDIRRRLRELLVEDGDWKSVAAIDLDACLASPHITHYTTLWESCGKARCWPRVRAFVLAFLETGRLSPLPKGARWPLPKTGVPPPKDAQPNPTALLEIALEEKRGKDAWAIYEKMDAKPHRDPRSFWTTRDDFGGRVADAVADELPEKALEIWSAKVKENLPTANEAYYVAVCSALGKMRPVMKRLGREGEWKRRVADIRESYKRRRRFVALLDEMASGRGATSRIADW